MPESTPPATADGTQSRSIRSLKSLGDLRDGLLVGFAVVYVTGFLTWAFRALQLNMGYIEVFKIQYIIAGITPTACFLVILHSMLRAGESSVSRERYQGLAVVIVLLFATLLLLDLLLVVLYVYFAGTPLMSLIELLDYPIGQIVATRVLPGLSHMGLYIFYMILVLIILHRLSPHTFSKLNDQHRRNSSQMFGKGTLWLTVIILLDLPSDNI